MRMVIILIILYFGIYLYAGVCAPSITDFLFKLDHNFIRWELSSSVIDKCDTGDILLFSGRSHAENVMKWCTDSIFSHVALVVRINNEPYLFESDIGQTFKSGVRLIPLRTKLKKYKGYSIGGWKTLLTQRPNPDEIKKYTINHQNIDMDNFIFTWWVSDYMFLYDLFKQDNKAFCSEVIVDCLRTVSHFDTDKVSSWYDPGSFFEREMKLGGVKYGDCVFFNF